MDPDERQEFLVDQHWRLETIENAGHQVVLVAADGTVHSPDIRRPGGLARMPIAEAETLIRAGLYEAEVELQARLDARP